MGAPQIHHRLAQFAQFDPPERPWLVTHALAGGEGELPELWGIDCAALPQELSHLEGLTLVIELPAPRALGRANLGGDQFNYIPLYQRGDSIPDPHQRLRELAIYLLGGIPKALEEDIEGATLEIRVTG